MTANYPSSMGGSEVVFLAAGPPTATDDATTCGVREGNRWHDQIADNWYLCSNATTGAAVWKLLGSGGGGGITDAPSDGKTYGRLNAAWSQVLPITGGIVSGNLTVTGTTTLAGSTSTGLTTLINLNQWSSGNAGKQLLLTTSSGQNNPALGLTDNAGANLLGIINSGGALRFMAMPAYSDTTTAPVARLDLTAGSANFYTPVSHANYGANFGSVVAGSTIDLSKHVALYSTTYGFNVTTQRLNYVAGSAASHVFVLGTSDVATISLAGVTIPGTLAVTGALSGTGFTNLVAPYAPLASPALTGTPTAPTAAPGTSTTQLATTAFAAAAAAAAGVQTFNTRAGAVTLTSGDVTAVLPASTLTPVMDGGVGAVGVSTTAWARSDHQHPSDTSRLATAGGTISGNLTVSGTATLATATATTPGTADNSTNVATTAYVQSVIAPAFNDVGSNKLHNPMFNVQQRGAGPWTANGLYTADRWVLQLSLDTASVTIAALADADRTQIGDEVAAYTLQNVFTGNATATAFNAITQRIEGVRRLSNKSVTVSFWAKATVAAVKLGVSADQSFGTGGSPSAAVTGTGQAVTLSTTWARYSVTLAIASTSGKVLGTTLNTDFTALNLWYSAGTTVAPRAGSVGVQSGTVSIWGMQLEIGVLTPLERVDPRTDLSNCQRFYNTFSVFVPAVAAPDTLVMPTTMRGTPTVAGGGAGFVTTGATASATAVTVGQTTGAAQTLTFTADL
jgi:hypothetical protein